MTRRRTIPIAGGAADIGPFAIIPCFTLAARDPPWSMVRIMEIFSVKWDNAVRVPALSRTQPAARVHVHA